MSCKNMTKANYKFVRLVARFSFSLLRFKSLDLISECIMCCLRGYSLVSCTDILGASHELRRINYKALKVLYIYTTQEALEQPPLR